MGYESRLYIVNKTNIVNSKRNYAQVIAVFDLCKVYEVSNKMRKYPITDVYFYSNDTLVTEDFYGEPLTEIPLTDAINIIEEAMKNDNYRRYNPCLQLLKGFNLSEWKNIVVLHFGY